MAMQEAIGGFAGYETAIDKIVNLAKPPVVEADGEQYIINGYSRAVKPTEELTNLLNEQNVEKKKLEHEQDMLQTELDFNAVKAFGNISTLLSLCDMLKSEVESKAAAFPFFVSVNEYNGVNVYGSYEANFSRRHLYSASADNKHFEFGSQPLEKAIIMLQSLYEKNDDVDYVIELCSQISSDTSVKTEDNGLTQSVQVKKGIMLKVNETVRNRVKLKPFRTFMEIEQPESEFLLRLSEQRDEIYVSLIESDGGAWKLDAKNNIAEFLKENLADLISENKVIVLQ